MIEIDHTVYSEYKKEIGKNKFFNKISERGRLMGHSPIGSEPDGKGIVIALTAYTIKDLKKIPVQSCILNSYYSNWVIFYGRYYLWEVFFVFI
ncbi:hypothetical protein H4O18_13600 [Arenibacter sp. BSSL-BM3]|uniref:Uncharacterized protein n=1 Tax=Arenibacter arenosicollis TaxID=2762274 RepID=A0ABR7QPB5_9FLAO|nr:hypothetical protein [Arenibacter arenosicollis]MBC8769032.1 hypothetical protein [Arenibacter arenosicollis]